MSVSTDPSIALHQLTALELSPVELVDLAAKVGCSHVGIFTSLPKGIATRFPCVITPEHEAALAERLTATGVQVNNAEVFALREGVAIADYREGLARAARLGARVATVHVHEPGIMAGSDLLRAFADLAAEHGLRVALEFTSFSAVRSLTSALQVLDHLQHPAVCLAIDALHFFRNGGQTDLLQQVPTEWIGYVQLCDGLLRAPDDLYHEAVAERLVPGTGEFPLIDLLRQLDQTVMLDIEVPRQVAQRAGMHAILRATEAVESTCNMMRQAGWRCE